MPPTDIRDRLSAAQREALAAGRHAEVAAQLREAGEHARAGWVLEQIWDFDGALMAYRDGERRLDALRMALELQKEWRLDETIAAIEAAAVTEEIDAAIALLRRKRRDREVARLLALRQADPIARADALARAGDAIAAAELLASAGLPREALATLRDATASPSADAIAAQLCWDLGDAEGAARHAQSRLRTGVSDPETAALLARALGSLGHDLAAQLVLERSGVQPSEKAVPGRYRITGVHSGGLVGTAYVGFDRLTLQEVEVHLLLAEQHEAGSVEPAVRVAIERFAAAATAAANVGHPAIRPIVRLEPAAGLVVLPRAEGPSVRSMIRPPGLWATAAARARALLAFMLEGLVAAHEHGLVHGWLLPSQIVTDALGRPLLPPFGAHHLSGLAATHTGALQELVTVTAPELRRGAPPTVEGDLYAIGALLAALLLGQLSTDFDHQLQEVGATPEIELARRLLDPDPRMRPTADVALEILHAPVPDLRAIGLPNDFEASASRSSASGTHLRLADGVEQVAAESWDDELLAALCREGNPWWQPILDRADRTIVLAPWPTGSHAVDAEEGEWRSLVVPQALAVSDPALRDAIEHRLTAASLVVTPSRAIMLALDDLLTR